MTFPHDPEQLQESLLRHSLMEEIAHRIDKNHGGFLQRVGSTEAFRVDGELEPVRESFRTFEPIGNTLSVAIAASLADFVAAG